MAKMKLRLAFREEGTMWNAYLAKMDTMVGARLVGSIIMGAVTKSPAIKKAFMDTMKMMMTEAIEDVTGETPAYWDEQPAPESERSGHS